MLLKQSIHILLEGVPEEIDIELLRQDILTLPQVQGIHRLKVWAISSNNIHLTAHLYAPGAEHDELYKAAMLLLSEKHHIHEITLQVEQQACVADLE